MAQAPWLGKNHIAVTMLSQIKSNQIYFSVAGKNNTQYKSIHIKITFRY